jgi:hypothetical protein
MSWQQFPCDEWPKGKTINGYGKRKIRGKTVTAHRAEWLEKRGPIPEGMNVLHRCDNRPCRQIEHLFLGTTQDNADDMVSKGRSTHGTRNNTTKLTPTQVDEVRAAYKTGETQRDLATRYGVCKSTIGYLVRGETWKHHPVAP